jgi:formamidopyrimidine-DNA glycosylase
MPELPEVETVVRSIKPHLVGQRIIRINPARGFKKVIATHSKTRFNKHISDQIINRVWRRGKYIVLDLDKGHVAIHLRMTGRLLSQLRPDDNPNHITLTMELQNGKRLFFKDYRKFGRWFFFPDLNEFNDRLGIEPLSDDFTPEWLITNLKAKNRQLKALLLDQTFIAGLGNIYVDEALWASRLHPRKISSTVGIKKARALHSAIRTLLQRAIDRQGTTIINFYFGEQRSEGNFREKLQVFDRTGKPCPRCDTTIRKIRVVQRGTHICPHCQRS